MTTSFVRPNELHDPANVLSASSEQGLTIAPPTPSTSNAGQLRLRATGTPTAEASLDVRLQTGGSPTGYKTTTGTGQGAGVEVIWKKTTDSGSVGTLHWRGYIDTPHLLRADYPHAYGTGLGKPSTPRELKNGNLGFVVHHNTTVASAVTFVSITTANVATTTTVFAATATGDQESDFVVMPDGTLVLIRMSGTSTHLHRSTDHGATWSTQVAAGSVTAGLDSLCLEYSEDMITMVASDSAGAVATMVRISRDGGYNWTTVDTAQTLDQVRTCVTLTGKILAISVAASPLVREIAPGGGLSTTTVASGLTCDALGKVAIVIRDDGTIWALSWNVAGATRLDMDMSVSTDGGATFTNDLAGLRVLDLCSNLANRGYRTIRAGSWAGKIIVLAQSITAGGGASDYNLHMLTFGGWESVTDMGTRGSAFSPFNHTYLPIDYPDALVTPWVRTNAGAGATVTNQGPLRFVSTAANATLYDAPTSMVAASNAGGTYRLRVRCRQVSGGTIASTSNGVRLSISDGAGNHQGFILRMSTTQFQIVDTTGASVATITTDMTKVTDFLFAFKHDNVANTSGLLSCWYIQDGDATWTLITAAATIGESVTAGNSLLRIGGTTPVAGTWDLYYVGLADSSNTMQGGFTNPADLAGRCLAADADYYLTSGIHLGGRNGGGIPADAYTVVTSYQYGKESIWRELRPSRKVHSSADNASWSVVFDAGANDTFRGDTVALFGCNFNTCKFQMNATNSWGAPSVEVSLSAQLKTGTVGAGVRGPGYFGPTTSPNWVPHAYRSDGDGHRYFVDVGSATYEITDNDESRIYVADVDFSAVAGTFNIFGDKTASTFTFGQYRYARLLVGAQQTSDNVYHLGTIVIGKRYTPIQTYDNGFVDRVAPNVEVFESDAGYRASARKGPRRSTLSIQWPPLNVLNTTKPGDQEDRIRALYSAIEGPDTPIVFWRDTSDIATVMLVRVVGTYQASNLRGELTTALTRIDQLVLEECL
jgi:hypothetical protein